MPLLLVGPLMAGQAAETATTANFEPPDSPRRALTQYGSPNAADPPDSTPGALEGVALTPTDYPEGSHTAGAVASAYAGSLGGVAIDFPVNESLPDALVLSRLRKPE